MGEFVSLTETLAADDFEKSFVDLSPDKQDLIRRRLPAAPDADLDSLPGLSAAPARHWGAQGLNTRVSAWDCFSADQRRAAVKASDWEHDQDNEQIRQKLWEVQEELTARIKELDAEIQRLDPKTLTDWGRQFDLPTRRRLLATHRLDLAKLRVQERELLDAEPAELRSVLERLISLRTPTEGGAPAPLGALHGSESAVGQSEQPASPGAGDAPPNIDEVVIRRSAGRPKAKPISIAIYEQRRAEEITPEPSQLNEAEAILLKWPKDGMPKPKPSTVSGHISELWKRDKSPDKR